MSKSSAAAVGSIPRHRFRSCFQNDGNRVRSRDPKFDTPWDTGGSLQTAWEISTPGTVRSFRETGEFPFANLRCECPIEEVLAYLKGNFPAAVRHNRQQGYVP